MPRFSKSPNTKQSKLFSQNSQYMQKSKFSLNRIEINTNIGDDGECEKNEIIANYINNNEENKYNEQNQNQNDDVEFFKFEVKLERHNNDIS